MDDFRISARGGMKARLRLRRTLSAIYLFLIEANNGGWPELMAVGERYVTHVIPRLLGVLQSEGRITE
jgi:hypothetical protein